MKRMRMDFEHNTVTTEGMGLDDVPPGDLWRAKNAICKLLPIDPAARSATLDFEEDTICCDGLTVEYPQLEYFETDIELLLWHRQTGLTNVVALVNALLSGDMDFSTFRTAMLLEGQELEPNKDVTEYLRQIAGEEPD